MSGVEVKRLGSLLGKAATAFLVGSIIGSSFLMTRSVSAHPSGVWYTNYWDNSNLGVVNYFFDTGYPSGGGWRARFDDAGDEWSVIQPSSFQFFRRDEVSQDWGVDCNGNTDVVVFHRPLTGVYAKTIACFKASGAFKSVHVGFDENESWYVGTGDPLSSTIDLRHIATHELGHVTGMPGHFGTHLDCDQVAPYDFASWQTMCNTIDVLLDDAGGEYGKKFRRSLEGHDDHTFDGAY